MNYILFELFLTLLAGFVEGFGDGPEFSAILAVKDLNNISFIGNLINLCYISHNAI